MRRKLEDGLDLFASYAEFFHKLFNGHVLNVFKDCRNGRPGSAEHPGATALAWNAFDGGTLGPIKSCHILTLNSGWLSVARS
jgi:hypothetical protein